MDFLVENTGLDLISLAYAFVVLIVAGFVRGYSGFGFSAITVTALSIFLLPIEIVPVVIFLEVLASLHMLPKAWNQTDWKLIFWLMLGATVATPLGVWVLATLPEKPMRITLCLVVLGLSFLLLRGQKISNPEHSGTRFSAGLVSGLFNGAAAIGGLPVVLFLIAAAAEAAILRATMASYFLFTEFLAIGFVYFNDLLNIEMFWRVTLFALPMIIGVQLGSRHFFNANPESFKRFALSMLVLLAGSGLIKALLG